jgi:hypothetical protein
VCCRLSAICCLLPIKWMDEENKIKMIAFSFVTSLCLPRPHIRYCKRPPFSHLFSPLLSRPSCLSFALCLLLSAFCSLPSALCPLLCSFCSVSTALRSLPFALSYSPSALCFLYSVFCTLFSALCLVFSIFSTPPSALQPLHFVFCSLSSAPRSLLLAN